MTNTRSGIAKQYCYEHPRPAVTVDIVLFHRAADDIEVLLIKRAREPFKDRWAFPGGFVDENESLEEAAARELKEETGVSGIALEQIGAFGDPGRDPRGHTVSVAFSAVVSDRLAAAAGDDAADARWHSAISPPKLAFDHAKILSVALGRMFTRKSRSRDRDSGADETPAMSTGEFHSPGLSIALIEPEIPPNTGNIARLCAATFTPLHLVGKLGFRTDDKAVRRAGLDYWAEVDIHHHLNLDALYAALAGSRFLYFTTKAERSYTSFEYAEGDCLVFGSETRGLPEELLRANRDRTLTIPMANPRVRSLNLATSVGIVLYEALRQLSPTNKRAPLGRPV